MSFSSITLRERSTPYIISRPHVILVEDDETQGWSISRKIERCGADCTLIADLAEAEQSIPQVLSIEHPYRPTILLMDQQLPYDHAHNTGVDGWTLMAELLGQMHDGVLHPALLVAISADLYGENRDFYNQQIGAHAVIEKPLHEHQVQALLEQVVTTVPQLPPPIPKKRPDEPVAVQRWSIGDLARRALQGLRQMAQSQPSLQSSAPVVEREVLQSLWRRNERYQDGLIYLQYIGMSLEEWINDRAFFLETVYLHEPYASIFRIYCQTQSASRVAGASGYTRRHIYRLEEKILDILMPYEYQWCHNL